MNSYLSVAFAWGSAFFALFTLHSPATAEQKDGKPADIYPVVTIPAGEMTYDVPVGSYTGVSYVNVKIKFAKPYKIGKHEVTVALWNQCAADGWCKTRPELSDPKIQNHPIVKVNWHDAYRFSLWLSAKTGHKYRLPTEHEWFYAANEGKYRREQSKTYSYADIEAIRKTPKVTYPVGTFGSNKWGVLDTAGNVWEWTLTGYALAEETIKKPQNPKTLNDPEHCTTRITGGEHRAHVPDFISDTYNGGCATLKPAANLGFRLVLEESTESKK